MRSLFLALLDRENPRGHPLLAALLYAWCPAAARWWLAGADPVLAYDPVWSALTDRAQGLTLFDVLKSHGLENLKDAVKTYIAEVEVFRRLHPALTAPETLPFFPGRLTPENQFNLTDPVRTKFGGDWKNLFRYVRTWVFTLEDWQRKLEVDAGSVIFEAVRLALPARAMRKNIYLPAWRWREKEKDREALGLLGDGEHVDQLLLSVVRSASPVGAAWLDTPEMYTLDGARGLLDIADVRLGKDAGQDLATRLGKLAETGPWPPLPALRRAPQCNDCGFRALCLNGSGRLTPQALAFETLAVSSTQITLEI